MNQDNKLTKIEPHKLELDLVDCLANNPLEVYRIEKKLAISDTFKMHQLRQARNPEGTVKMIAQVVGMTAELFNLKNPLTASQIGMISYDLFEVFGYETIGDIILMFKLGRTGKLGDTYGNFDHSVIFQKFVPAYLDMKAIERERLKHKKENGNLHPEVAKAMVKAVPPKEGKEPAKEIVFSEKAMLYLSKLFKEI